MAQFAAEVARPAADPIAPPASAPAFAPPASDPAIGSEIAMDAWPRLPPAPAGHPCPLFRPAPNTAERAVATFAMG